MAALSLLIDFLTLTQVDLLSLTEILIEHIYLPLLRCIPRLHRLQFISHLFELSAFVIMIATSLLELLKKLNLVIFFNPVELAELIQFSDERIDHLHAFKELSTAFLVTSVLLTLSGVKLALQVCDLILESADIALLGPQLHNFLP